MFMYQCRRTGLDPFAKQIHAVKRWDSKAGREVMAIQTGIDGFRLVADRTGDYDGQDAPLWKGRGGEWVEVWEDSTPPFAAKVSVYRKGVSRPFTVVAKWDAYAQTKKDGSPTQFWARMGDFMLAKCAEALALRKAFPQELSGLYTTDEMAQASNDAAPRSVADAQPEKTERVRVERAPEKAKAKPAPEPAPPPAAAPDAAKPPEAEREPPTGQFITPAQQRALHEMAQELLDYDFRGERTTTTDRRKALGTWLESQGYVGKDENGRERGSTKAIPQSEFLKVRTDFASYAKTVRGMASDVEERVGS
jgi:phage recombination protein Bet